MRDEIRRHEDLYYLEENPEISDQEYDELLENFANSKRGIRNSSRRTAPLNVWWPACRGFPEFVHRRPMLSLDNSYNIDELRAFDAAAGNWLMGIVGIRR